MLELADYLGSAVRSHIDPALEVALLAELEIHVEIRFSVLLCYLVDGLALIFLISRTDIRYLNIFEAEAEKYARRLDEHAEFELVERLFALLFAHSLIPHGEHDRYDGHAQSFVIYIEHRVDAVFAQTILNGDELILVAERLAADKYRVRMLELEVRTL